MSSSRGRFTEEEINDLTMKLQELLQHSTSRIPVTKILEETYNYTQMLKREVDDLTERLSQMLDNNPNLDLCTIISQIFFNHSYIRAPNPHYHS